MVKPRCGQENICSIETNNSSCVMPVAVDFIREQVLVVRGTQCELQPAARRAGENVGERRDACRDFGEADLEGEGERDEKEHQQEQQRRQDDEPAAWAPGQFHAHS